MSRLLTSREPTIYSNDPPAMTQEEAAAQLLRYFSGTATPEDLADLLIPLPAVDLRSIPRDRWREFVLRSVTLPPELLPFITGQSTFTRVELDGLEDRIARFHGLTAPYFITAKAGPPFDAWLVYDPDDDPDTAL